MNSFVAGEVMLGLEITGVPSGGVLVQLVLKDPVNNVAMFIAFVGLGVVRVLV